MKSAKKSKKDRGSESRDDGFKKKTGGVNYDAISDKRVDDKRHEREKAYKEQLTANSAKSTESASGGAGSTSSTFDAFQRMAAGKEGRTLAEKIADPNRPTWEQYKKVRPCVTSCVIVLLMHGVHVDHHNTIIILAFDS